MKILGLIPARSKSVRVKDKNIRPLGGNKPLMAWTIEVALKAGLSQVVVSTDSEEYSDVATFYGAHVLMRPTELSGDCDTGLVAKHVLAEAETFFKEKYDAVATLQPTSPFRSVESIDKACRYMGYEHDKRSLVDTVFSVKKISQHPAWAFRFQSSSDEICGPVDNFLGFPNKILSGLIAQDLPSLLFPNGAIYVTSASIVRQGRIFGDRVFAFLMPEEESLDIETEDDFRLAELMLEMKEK